MELVMKMLRLLFILALWAFGAAEVQAADNLTRREWKVNGVVREGLIYVPAQARTNATPVVFAFHGHGGSMRNAARSFGYHALWPEAIVVYLQGLNTPGRLTDPDGKKPGWQSGIGDQGDRDLEFFDTVLASLQREARVDDERIYATGHSNGGSFTYLLWAARGERFAAFARPAPQRLGCLPSSNPSRCCMWPARTIRWSNSPGRSRRWMRCEN